MIRLLQKHHEQDINASSGINAFLPRLHLVFHLEHQCFLHFLTFRFLGVLPVSTSPWCYLLFHGEQQVTPGLFLNQN